jgi:phosphocarrier protein HPr
VAWSAAERINWRWTESAYTLYDERGMRAVAMERGVSASPGVLSAQSSEAAHGNMLRRRGIQGRAARPASALFVQAANRLPVKVTIAKEGMKPVRAGSILMVLGLDVRGSEKVVLCADGNGAELALNKLADLVARPRRTGP